MKVLFLLVPFGVVIYNFVRAWQRKQPVFLVVITIACTAILLCAALFNAAVFLGHGGALATLQGIAPGRASLRALLAAVCATMAAVLVCWFASALCLFRKIKGWQTVLLLNMAVGILETALLLQIMSSGDWTR